MPRMIIKTNYEYIILFFDCFYIDYYYQNIALSKIPHSMLKSETG